MSELITLVGFAALFLSLVMIWFAVIFMIRAVNRNPGFQGRIPWYMSLPRMLPDDLFDRYKAAQGKGLPYRLYQLGWIVFGVGFISVMGSKLVDWLSTK
jgi:hypothetical protein